VGTGSPGWVRRRCSTYRAYAVSPSTEPTHHRRPRQARPQADPAARTEPIETGWAVNGVLRAGPGPG
jgi:hypothetical protein